MRQTLFVIALAVLAGGLGLWAGQRYGQRQPAAPPGVEIARIGDTAPDLALTDLDGRPRRLGEWNGRRRVINFWASWCGPCIEEMPLFDRLAQAEGEQGLQVIGIALDDAAAVREFLDRVPARYAQLIEAAGRSDSSVRHGNTRNVLPFTVLIGADNRIERVKVGAFPELQALERWSGR
jgi:thiol-disulfide isomerase/thioredoxin